MFLTLRHIPASREVGCWSFPSKIVRSQQKAITTSRLAYHSFTEQISQNLFPGLRKFHPPLLTRHSRTTIKEPPSPLLPPLFLLHPSARALRASVRIPSEAAFLLVENCIIDHSIWTDVRIGIFCSISWGFQSF